MKKATLLLLAGMLCAAGAQAQKRKQGLADSLSGQGYGMAGCGVGSIIFGDKPGMVQILASMTNQYSYQSFAISSGTSNCGESGRTAQVEQFIEVNKMALEKEMARGQGETISSLSEVMGCSNETFATEMAGNYRRAFPQGNATSTGLNKVALASCEM